MEKLKYAAKRLKEYKSGIGAVNEYDVIRAIVDVCKEEIPEWTFSAKIKEPELIQGLTAEQWQEIIAGGYVCEVRDDGGEWCLTKLVEVLGGTFFGGGWARWKFCRPAQIKGVMRPIFVEPVDKESVRHFFDKEGSFRGTALPWLNEGAESIDSSITKYIEL